MSRAREVLIGLDQLLNAALGGYADETMSARCWRLRAVKPYSILRPVIDRLFFLQLNHCQASYESEVTRSQLPKEYRDAESIHP